MDDVASIPIDPNPVLGGLNSSQANLCSGYSECHLRPFLPFPRLLMSVRQRTGHRVKEASKPANAAGVRSKHSKVKCYSLVQP